jgi:anti-anti-sigma factor
MPAPSLNISVRRRSGAVIVDLQGEVNAFAEEALAPAYAEASEPSPDAILLNFSRVEYINSTGIALIVGLLAQARKSGRPVLAFGLSQHYIEIFRITKLADFMRLFPDEASALAGIAEARPK